MACLVVEVVETWCDRKLYGCHQRILLPNGLQLYLQKVEMKPLTANKLMGFFNRPPDFRIQVEDGNNITSTCHMVSRPFLHTDADPKLDGIGSGSPGVDHIHRNHRHRRSLKPAGSIGTSPAQDKCDNLEQVATCESLFSWDSEGVRGR